MIKLPKGKHKCVNHSLPGAATSLLTKDVWEITGLKTEQEGED